MSTLLIHIIEGIIPASIAVGSYLYYKASKEGKKIKEKYNVCYKVDEAILNGPYRTSADKDRVVDIECDTVSSSFVCSKCKVIHGLTGCTKKQKEVVKYLWNAKGQSYDCPKCGWGSKKYIPAICYCDEYEKNHFHFCCTTCNSDLIMMARDDTIIKENRREI